MRRSVESVFTKKGCKEERNRVCVYDKKSKQEKPQQTVQSSSSSSSSIPLFANPTQKTTNDKNQK